MIRLDTSRLQLEMEVDGTLQPNEPRQMRGSYPDQAPVISYGSSGKRQ
jgi:hypothetical protein